MDAAFIAFFALMLGVAVTVIMLAAWLIQRRRR